MSDDLTPRPEERAIELMADGLSQTKALAIVGMTSGTFNRRCAADDLLASSYVRATQWRAVGHVDEIVDISDDPKIDPARARNMIDARKWSAQKMNPAKFSDRIEMNVTTIDLNAAMALAEARLRPVSDQREAVTDLIPNESGTYTAGPTDKQSDPPDIFS